MEIHRIIQDASIYRMLPFLLLYIGPETILPLTSALAAILGILLMFWHRFIGLLRKFWKLILRKDR